MKRVIALAIASALAVGANAAEKDPGKTDPKADAGKIESFTLKDGGTSIGIYDEATSTLKIADRRTGRIVGSMPLKPESIVERRPFAVDPTAGFSSAPPAALKGTSGEWIDSYQDAIAAAQAAHRLVLIDFTGSDWCGWCMKLHKEVFDTPDFKEWAKRNAVLLEADFPEAKPQTDEIKKQNAELQQKFGVSGYPTIVVIDAGGKEVARSGYLDGGAKAWISDIEGKASFTH